jgi:hypothetical protein
MARIIAATMRQTGADMQSKYGDEPGLDGWEFCRVLSGGLRRALRSAL